jgi:phosphohistidine phosphatase
MELYLAQHAESKSKEEDPGRGLTDHGFTNIRKIARFAKKISLTVDNIYHSDKLRAKQTANELAKNIKTITGVNQRDNLAPMEDISSTREEIQMSNKNLMIVGHLPFLNKLTSVLLCGNENQKVVSFQYGCIVKLVRNNETKAWSIKWMITPDIC